MAYFNRDRGSSGGGGRSFDRGGRGGGFSRGGDRGDRQMFDATCSNCGKACQVPFRPSGDKPVYCSDCFEKMGGRDRDNRSSDRPSFRSERPEQNNNSAQFEALGVKLDKIISLLEPKAAVVVKKEVSLEEKVPKVKKVASKKK